MAPKLIKDIKDLFDIYMENNQIIIDEKLYKSIKKYRLSWATKNNHVVEFLNSGLLGNIPARFTAADEDDFYRDVVGIDIKGLRKGLESLDGIDPDWNIATKPLNQLLVYLMFRFINKKDIATTIKQDAILELYLIYAYMTIGGRLYHFFTRTVDEQTALTVSEKLSDKFIIKRVGTWQKYFEYKAKSVLPGGRHTNRLKHYNTKNAVDIVNDLYNDINRTVINIFRVLKDVLENKETISSSSIVTISETGSRIDDMTSRPDIYVNAVLNTVYKQGDFISGDIIHLVRNIAGGQNNDDLEKTLFYMSENYMNHKTDIDFIIEKTITLALEYIARRNNTRSYTDNLGKILIDIRNYFSANIIKDNDILVVKKSIGNFYMTATRKRSKTYLANIRISVMLYIFIMAIKIK